MVCAVMPRSVMVTASMISRRRGAGLAAAPAPPDGNRAAC